MSVPMLARHAQGLLGRFASVNVQLYRNIKTILINARCMSSDTEIPEYDACIVGAGPSGLAAAIRLKQLSHEHGKEVSVCVLEKGSRVGSHILSGCVLEPTALDELLPEWRDDESCPVSLCPVTKDKLYCMTSRFAVRLPKPPAMKNKKNYVVSLSEVTRWLGDQAEKMGVEIFPGFAVKHARFEGKSGAVAGVVTGPMGVSKNGKRKDSFMPGMEVAAKVTLLAEGCRGSVSEEIIQRFSLRANCDPQTYALGIKEVWQVDDSKHKPGHIWHSVGYPLPLSVYGGGWLYHMAGGRVSLGYATCILTLPCGVSPVMQQ